MTQTLDNQAPGPQDYTGEHQAPPDMDGAGARLGGELVVLPPPPPEPRGPWGLWLRMTGPSRTRTHDASERERLRRSRLLSAMLAVALVVALALLPKGFIPVRDYGTLGGIAIVLLVVVICIPFNHFGKVNAAGAIFCVGVALAIAWSLLETPNGLGLQDLPTFDLFALPIVISGILLPRYAPFLFWLGCAAFIIGDMYFEPHQANLAAYISEVGLYATVIIPLTLTFVIAVVSWLGAGSVERAIIEADRTADLERAYRLIADQKQRLESAVAMIQSVHSRVANGDFSARATVGSGELMGLGVSLNLMLDRISRMRGAESALNAVEQGGRTLAQYAWELGAGRLQSAPPQTGAPLTDAIAAALDQMRRALYGQISALTNALQSVTRSGEDLVNATRALGWRTQEAAQRIGALNDTVRTMRDTAERAETTLAPPAEWLRQATEQGWSDGVALALAVAESLSCVRQVIAAADQSPVAAGSQEFTVSGERALFERTGAAEREFSDALTQARGLLSRLANQSGNLGPARPEQ